MPIYNPTAPVAATAKTLVYQDGTVPVGNTIASQSGSDVAFTSTYTIPVNTLIVGSVIRINLQGIYGTALIAPSITGKVKFGTATMLTTGTITAISSVTNLGWTGTSEFIVTSLGVMGTIESQGFMEFATAATTSLSVNLSNTSAVTVDTTPPSGIPITITIQWGTNSASNTITLRTITIYITNT